MGLFDLLKKGAKRMTGEKEYKDVFELDGVPAFREFYDFAIFPAKHIYRGLYTPWHVVPAPSISDPKRTRTLYRMQLGKAVCAELAGLIWSEGVKIDISDETLQEFVTEILRENNFYTKMQEHIEQSAALGGGAIKEYVKYKRENGQQVPGTEKIVLDYCMADQFVPTAWDNADVKEAIFVTRKAKDGYYYTRLEWHKWNGDTYIISNDLYQAPMKDSAGNNQDILGYKYPLAYMYPDLQAVTKIDNLDKSLFAYYRTPVANNVDDNSPLGVSVYGNAFDTLHALDICFDSFVREFRLGKKRIIVPAAAVRVVFDEKGTPRRYFDANDETYEALATDDPDKLKVQDNSVELRVEEHVAAINAFLSILCLQVGFSSGTFTFDLNSGLKTATEVISENSKTYKTIRNFQQQITPAIEKTVRNIIALGALYGMTYDGKSIAELAAKDYEIQVSMEDAVLEDTNTKYDKGIKLVGAGLISKRTALTDPAYGLCYTEENADKELEQIAKESPVNAFVVDRFSTTGAE